MVAGNFLIGAGDVCRGGMTEDAETGSGEGDLLGALLACCT